MRDCPWVADEFRRIADRYQALELKLRSVQESLELLADVRRDQHMLLLEAIIVRDLNGDVFARSSIDGLNSYGGCAEVLQRIPFVSPSSPR